MVELANKTKNKLSRFYKQVALDEKAKGSVLLLDGRVAKTPKRHDFLIEPPSLAEAIRQEWQEQGEDIDFLSMPLTRLHMTFLDADAGVHQKWRETPWRFIETDLLSFRASQPEALVALESQIWDPFCDWARDAQGVDLPRTTGLGGIVLSQKSRDALKRFMRGLDRSREMVFALACEQLGSVVLAMALLERANITELRDAEQQAADIFAASHLGETYQESQWGEDEEALVRRGEQARELVSFARYLCLTANPEN